MRIGAVLLMGGEGKRFGDRLPKQFHRLGGKRLFVHTLEVFLGLSWIDEVVLVCHPDWMGQVQEELSERVSIAAGGTSRQESSLKGLLGFRRPPEIVLIHDAVRPFVTARILEENVKKAAAVGAVDTCIPSADTLVHAPDGEKIAAIPVRDEWRRGQTPQTFRYPLILKAHLEAKRLGVENASDDCRLVLNLGEEVAVVLGDEHNIKVTTELDLFISGQLLRMRTLERKNPTGSVRGKRFAVIGGGGGIGSELCSQLEAEGAETIRMSRKTGVDLRDSDSIVRAFEEAGEIDGLINCAGVLMVKPLALYSILEIEELLQVNFTGLVIACQRAQVRAGGHVINLASSSFTRGRKHYGIYSGAKAAVVNFTQALAEERPDLRIHAVAPERTKTPMRAAHFLEEEGETLLDAKEVAETIVQLLKDPISTGALVEVRKKTGNLEPICT